MLTPDSSAIRGKSPLLSSSRRLIVSKMGSSIPEFSCRGAYSVKALAHGKKTYPTSVHRNKTLRQIVAENAKATRLDRKLSQPDVAKRAGRLGHEIDQSTVSRMERSTHPSSIDHLEALAKGLGVEPWRLLIPAGADESFMVLLRAWAQSGEQGRRLLLLAARGAAGRDDTEARADAAGSTHGR